MLENEYKQAIAQYELYSLTICFSNVLLYYQYMGFLCFFGTGCKKIFGMINKREVSK